MNTILTRMAYDRLTRQQQLSIAVVSTTTHTAIDRRIAGKKDNTSLPPLPPPPTSKHIINLFKVLMGCVVALITRNAVRRGGVIHSPEERGVVIHP